METVLTPDQQRQQTNLNATRTVAKYLKALGDVTQGINLQQHLDDITKSITVVDEAITKSYTNEPVPQSILDLKNNLYFLKWLILEKI